MSDGSTSDDMLSAGDNFFEDESFGSNSSDDDDDDGLGTPPQAEDMHKRYFGGKAWKSSVVDSSGSPSPSSSKIPMSPRSPTTRIKKIQTFIGPSSDMLSPVVSLKRRFDREMLGYQSIELAWGWQLGPWDADQSEVINDLFLVGEIDESKTEVPGSIDAGIQKGKLVVGTLSVFKEKCLVLSTSKVCRIITLCSTRQMPFLVQACSSLP